jgi:hypothetical protein
MVVESDPSLSPATPVLDPPQLEHGPAEPYPLLHRQPGSRTGLCPGTPSSPWGLDLPFPGDPRALSASGPSHRPQATGPRSTGSQRNGPGTTRPRPTGPGATGPGPRGPRPTGPRRSGAQAVAGLVDPVAEGGGQKPTEAGDVLHRHAEGADAAVALPDAQHHKVPLRMPGDPQPGPALVQEHIPAARQCRRVLHRPSVAAPLPRFKAGHLPGFSTFSAHSSNSTSAAARVPP